MKLTIGLVLGLVIAVVVGVMQMVRADHFENRLAQAEQAIKEKDGVCAHLAGEVRSAIRLPDVVKMKVGDDGTITIQNILSLERWEFPPNSPNYRVYSPSR